MQFIALLILCLAAISCDKKVVRSVDVPTEDVAVEDVPTEDVLANAALVCSGSLQLPTGAGMLAEDLQVLSFFGEVTPNAAGKFNISMADSKKPQFVIAIDPETDNSLLLGYIDPAQGEHVNLSCESTAVSLVFLNPLLIGTTAEQRSEFIRDIKAHPKFPLLVDNIEATFQSDPQHLLDADAHPELYEQAVEIFFDILQQRLDFAGKPLATTSDGPVPWIKEVRGNEITFANLAMTHYVAGISKDPPDNNNFLEFVDVEGVPHFLYLGWKVWKGWGRPNEPQLTDYTLPENGDGVFHIYLTKGQLIGGNTADIKATTKNLATFIEHISNLLGGVLEIAGVDMDALQDLFITSIGLKDAFIEVIDNPSLGSIFAFLKAIFSFIIDNIDKIAEAFGFGTDDGVFKKVMERIVTSLKGSAKMTKAFLKKITVVETGIHTFNVMVPFFSHWMVAGDNITYTISRNNGKISLLGTDFPPVPDNAVEFSLLNDVDMDFVWIDPGEFRMGSSSFTDSIFHNDDEGQMHGVGITKGFWLGKYEVTQGQWEAVMEGDQPWSGGDYVQSGTSNPAVYISWEDVQDFIDKLNDAEGSDVYRLPTEAEWEYACRAGTQTPWSFGGDWRQLQFYAWSWNNVKDSEDDQRGHTVGTKRANPWGLHDMHGNVAEWVQDWYSGSIYNSYYQSSGYFGYDPQGPTSGRERVVRGGSFVHPVGNLRSADRDKYPPDASDFSIGFRLVRNVEPTTKEFSLPNDAEMDFVWIEQGTFTVGSPLGEQGRGSDEGPAHWVGIREGFWLGQYEVTQEQWEAVMGTTPWAGQSNVQEGSDYPAVYISWKDVQDFIIKLNRAEGEWLYRLPTEAEWEYACRAGRQTPWSFGDDSSDLTKYAWYGDNASGANAVGLNRANAWGLHDMHGNVWEWVQDWYDEGYYANYADSPRDTDLPPEPRDPLGPTSGFNRVRRGGSFVNNSTGLRSANRADASPYDQNAGFGVRLLRVEVPDEWPEDIPFEAPREDTFSLRGADMEMVWIESGVFEMGSGDSDEGPVHAVVISEGFWLGKHEVTQEQWEAVMGGTDWAAPWAGKPGSQSDPAYPATYVSWEAVQEFIARLNEMEGRYYRLPTEAEWEYACRAGTTTRWSFGDDTRHLKYFAWFLGGNDAAGVSAVGEKRTNAWGLRDMHGNVAEWVQDWYDEGYYANSPLLDPQGPSWPPFGSAPQRVVRGGAFDDLFGWNTRSASRSFSRPGDTDAFTSAYIGFRLVRDEEPQEPPTGTVSLPGEAEMEFVWIEPGVFQMGSPESEKNRGSDETLHEVEISTGFWLGKYEVTQEQWYAVMETTPWDGAVNQVNLSHPAGAPWDAVQAFIDSLNAAAGEQQYRLPTEAEWEYACRAGMPTRWSFGDDERRLEHYAWYDLEDAQGVQPVGTKRANAWGLHDMHGNVWEWVQDWYDAGYYASSPRVDPPGPDTGDERVSRGGVFANGPSYVRSALRRSFYPGTDENRFRKTFGFRLVMIGELGEVPTDPREVPPVDEEDSEGPSIDIIWIKPGEGELDLEGEEPDSTSAGGN